MIANPTSVLHGFRVEPSEGTYLGKDARAYKPTGSGQDVAEGVANLVASGKSVPANVTLQVLTDPEVGGTLVATAQTAAEADKIAKLAKAKAQVPPELFAAFPGLEGCLQAFVDLCYAKANAEVASNAYNALLETVLDRFKASRVKIEGIAGKDRTKVIEHLQLLRKTALTIMDHGWRYKPTAKGTHNDPLVATKLNPAAYMKLTEVLPGNPYVKDDLWQAELTAASPSLAKVLDYTYGDGPDTLIPDWNALVLMSKHGLPSPKAGEGYLIPKGLPELKEGRYNFGMAAQYYVPKFGDVALDNLEKLAAKNLPVPSWNDAGNQRYGHYLDVLAIQGAIAETALVDIINKMVFLEALLDEYNNQQRAEDYSFYALNIGKPFSPDMLVQMVKQGKATGSFADIGALVSLMKKAGKGTYTPGKLFQAQADMQVLEAKYKSLLGPEVAFAPNSGAMVKFNTVKGCENLPYDVQYAMFIVASVEAYADASNQTADMAADLVTKIEALSAKIIAKAKEEDALYQEKKKLDAQLAACLKAAGSNPTEQAKCNKLKQQRQNIALKRAQVIEDATELARQQAKLGNARYKRNETSKAQRKDVLGTSGYTVSYTGADGKAKSVSLQPSSEAKAKLDSAGATQKQTDAKAKAAHDATNDALKQLSAHAKDTGVAMTTTSVPTLDDIVIPSIEDITPQVDDKPFPWLLLLAAGLGATKTIPVAAAAALGALGLAQLRGNDG